MVERHERVDVGLLVAVFFLLALGYVVGQAAGYALFVKRFGARELPFAILCMPLFGVVLAWANLRAVRRVGLPRALVLDVCGMVVVGIVLRAAVADDAHTWVRFVLPMWDAGVNNLNNLVVWGAATRLFDVRQAKRVGPVVSAGRSVALVVGGFLVPAMVHSVGTANLYVLQAAMFGAATLVLVVLARLRHDVLAGTSPRAVATAGPPPSSNGADAREVRAIFGFVFASMLAYVLVRNIFLDRGAARYPLAADYAARIGVLNALQGILTLISGLLLSSRFLRRYGLRGGLLALPTTLVLVYAPLALLGLAVGTQFTIASIGFVVCGAMMFSIRTPAVQLLYQPLDAVSRTRAVSKAEGIVEPLALGSAAVVLLVVARAAGLGARGMALAVLVAAVALVWVGRRAADGYRRSLERVLAHRWLRGDAVDLTDPATTAALLRSADEGDGPHAVALVGMVEEAGGDSTPLLVRLTGRPEPDVRAFALTALLDRRHDLDRAVVREMADGHPAPEVRAAATRLLCRGGDLAAAARAASDPSTDVRAAALAGLLESDARDARELAASTVAQLAASDDVDDRRVVARALARSAGPAPHAPIVDLVRDPDHAVRADAYVAAGRRHVPVDLTAVVASLGDRAMHTAAADALVAYGDDAISSLERAVDARGADPRVVRRAVRVLGHLEGPGAAAALARLVQHPEPAVRGDATRALRRRDARLGDDALAGTLGLEQHECLALRNDIAALDPAASAAEQLLLAALHERERDLRRRVLDLVSLRDGAASADDVDRALRSDDPKLRAYAVESLDTALPASLRTIAVPLLTAPDVDGPDPARAVVDAERRAAVLARRRDGEDPWLALLAATASGARLRPEGDTMVPLVERVLFLKQVGPFAHLPTDTLSHVAAVLSETRLDAGATLFAKGDRGTSMYLVFDGEVRIHDGAFELDRRSRHAMFGELAVFDAEPRTADATAVTDTLLLRLDQEPLYELMADRPDVLRGFVSNIVSTLRDRLVDVAALRRTLAASTSG